VLPGGSESGDALEGEGAKFAPTRWPGRQQGVGTWGGEVIRNSGKVLFCRDGRREMTGDLRTDAQRVQLRGTFRGTEAERVAPARAVLKRKHKG